MSPHVFSLAPLFLSCNRALCSRRSHRRFPAFQFVAALVEIGNKAVSQHAENGTLGGTTRHGKPTKQAPSLRDASKCQGSKTCACGASDSAGSGIQDRWCMHTEENCRTALQGAVFRRSWLCARHQSGTSINGAARLCSPTYRVHPLLGGQDAMPAAAPCPCLPVSSSRRLTMDSQRFLRLCAISCAAHQHAGSPANYRAGFALARA